MKPPFLNFRTVLRTPGRRTRGFTLVEMMVSTMILGLAGGIVYTVADLGARLFARNSSINVSHSAASKALNHIAVDIEQSICRPILLDGNGTVLSDQNSLNAMGIRVRRVVNESLQFSGTTVNLAGSSFVMVLRATRAEYLPNEAPQVGDLLFVKANPSFSNINQNAMEIDSNMTKYRISSVSLSGSGNSTQWTLTFPGSFAADMGNVTVSNTSAVIARDISYRVVAASDNLSAQLRQFPNATNTSVSTLLVSQLDFQRMATGTTPRVVPFSFQTYPTATGEVSRRMVDLVLPLRDRTYSNRIARFNSAYMVDAIVAYKAAGF